jgi:hypothetical protein
MIASHNVTHITHCQIGPSPGWAIIDSPKRVVADEIDIEGGIVEFHPRN